MFGRYYLSPRSSVSLTPLLVIAHVDLSFNPGEAAYPLSVNEGTQMQCNLLARLTLTIGILFGVIRKNLSR